MWGNQTAELKAKVKSLKEQIEELKFKKRLEQEEIIHLNKLNDERNEQKLKSKELELEKKYADENLKFQQKVITQIKDHQKQMHEKMEARFNTELGNLKEIYQSLMKRLPTFNFNIDKQITG